MLGLTLLAAWACETPVSVDGFEKRLARSERALELLEWGALTRAAEVLEAELPCIYGVVRRPALGMFFRVQGWARLYYGESDAVAWLAAAQLTDPEFGYSTPLRGPMAEAWSLGAELARAPTGGEKPLKKALINGRRDRAVSQALPRVVQFDPPGVTVLLGPGESLQRATRKARQP